jgi:ribonuclease HI
MCEQQCLFPEEKWYAWTDGALKASQYGGWAAILRCGEKEVVLSGEASDTTNNRMELLAAIEAMRYLPQYATLHLTSDSKYVVQGATEWLDRWIANKWRTAIGRPVKNVDLWKQFHNERRTRSVTFEWVKGHNGHEMNERADTEATRAAYRLQHRGCYA